MNRIIRDIPNINILGGNQNVNLRQKVLQIMKEKNQECKCIRCREIKDNKYNINHCELFIDQYNSYNGIEYFINYSSPCRKYLFGFIRLRINYSNENIIYDSVDGLPEDRGQRELLLMDAMESALKEGHSNEYQEIIKLYFYNLQKNENE